jgi:hypothetical protein
MGSEFSSTFLVRIFIFLVGHLSAVNFKNYLEQVEQKGTKGTKNRTAQAGTTYNKRFFGTDLNAKAQRREGARKSGPYFNHRGTEITERRTRRFVSHDLRFQRTTRRVRSTSVFAPICGEVHRVCTRRACSQALNRMVNFGSEVKLVPCKEMLNAST